MATQTLVSFPNYIGALCGVFYVRIGVRYVWINTHRGDIKVLRSAVPEVALDNAFALADIAAAKTI